MKSRIIHTLTMKRMNSIFLGTELYLVGLICLFCSCSKDQADPYLKEEFILQDDLLSPSITWDGSHLWILADGFCYQISIKGEIVTSFDVPGEEAGGIEWDGSYLWIHNGGFYGHGEPPYPTIYKITTTGEIISSFTSPVIYPHEIVWDGNCFWIYGGSPSGLGDWYKINVTGEIVESIEPSLGNYGAAWNGQNLWCVVHPSKVPDGGRYSKLFRMSSTGEIIESYTFDNEQFWGLAFDHESFWVISCRSGESNYRICRIKNL